MTESEAVEVLAELHKAVRALQPMTAIQAINVLFNPAPKYTTASIRARHFSSSLTTLRVVFDEMEHKGIKFPA